MVTIHIAKDRNSELDWIANSISNDIKQENVSPRQIVVISLDTSKTRDNLTGLQRRLVDYNIASTIPGIVDAKSDFAVEGRVTLSTVYRAKGNESHIVYILGFDTLYDYIEGIGNRNRAFASITRSKAWVRISGVGKKMEKAKAEIDRILVDIPRFKFTFPDMRRIRRLDAENSRIRKEANTAENAIENIIKTKREVLGALDPEKVEQLRKLLNEVASENQ